MKYALCVVAIFAAAIPASAGDKLTGSFYFTEENCGTTAKNQRCNLTIQFTGEAAKALYDNMKVKAVKEECTGGMEKTDGKGLNCIKDDKGKVECDFGYDFKKKEFGGSNMDC